MTEQHQPAYKEVYISEWRDFLDIFESPMYRSWAFRGHRNANWKLQTALARYFNDFTINRDAWPVQEERILRIFKRKANLYLDSNTPKEGDSFQWLSLMQHFGAPTRLLDFTWSPYVAAFFALERATHEAAVWAVFPPALYQKKYRTVSASQKAEPGEMGPWVEGNYEKYFLRNKFPIVMVGEPLTMNQRLIAQSGTFAMPGVLDIPIDQIITEQYNKDAIVKFVLDAEKVRRNAMRSLYNMNITQASLFPDLNGLARSMAVELEFHWAYDPLTMEKFEGFHLD